MEEKMENEGFSIKEMFTALLKKFKLLILVLLAGVVVGGGIGFLLNMGKKSYGTSIEFYINPVATEEQVESNSYFALNGTYTYNVMDGLVKLLASESFAERLLMDKDGIPVEKFLNEENRTAIDNAIAVAEPLILAVQTAEEALEAADEERLDAQKEYNLEYSKWSAYQSEILFAKEIGNVDVIPALTVLMDSAKARRDATKEVYSLKTEAWEAAQDALKEAQKAAEKAKEDIYVEYRKTSIYKKYLTSVRSSLSFSWYDSKEEGSLEKIARSFVYVSVQVDSNEKLANDLYDQICEVLPSFVSTAMPKPSGYSATACRQVSRLDEVKRLNENQAIKVAVRYAFLAGFAALAVTCVVVVIIDKNRKNKAQ